MSGRLGRWLDAVLGRRRFESRLSAEIEHHLALRAEELRAAGLAPGEARRRARLDLGMSPESVREECREARHLAWSDELVRNARQALRVLARSPGLTLTIVLTLGLGLGANTAVLSVVSAVMLRPLPYPAPERLALVQAVYGPGEEVAGRLDSHDGRTWEAVRGGTPSLLLAAYSGWPSGANVVVGDQALYLPQQRVGAGFFSTLGVPPMLGREFTPSEDVSGGPAVVVISYGLWQRLFGGDPAALGRALLLRGAPHQIIGVMPAGFRGGVEAELWTPLRPATTGEGAGTNYGILARLKPGASWPEARRELRALGAARLAEIRWPSGEGRLDLLGLQAGQASDLRRRLLVAWVVAVLLLAVAAVNVAGLLLAHGARRAAEIATRLALGGGRWAIIRQLLAETLAVAVLGGLCGLVLGGLGIASLRGYARDLLGIWQPITIDLRVALGVCGLVLLTVVVSGLYPAVAATRVRLQPASLGGDGRVAGVRTPWPRRLLVGVQLALVVALLVGAGLLLRSLGHLHRLAPGFRPEGLLAARVSLQDERYATSAAVGRLVAASLADLRRQAGVEHAAVGLSLPFERPLNMGFQLPGDADPPSGPRITNLIYTSDDYFATLGVPVLQGRSLAASDAAGGENVVVVNAAFADAYLEGTAVVGARLAIAGSWRRVVGVVGDTQQHPSWGADEPLATKPGAYVPLTQVDDGFLRLVHTWFEPSWIVRSRLGEAAAGERLRAAIQRADPGLPVAAVRSLAAVRDGVLGTERFQAVLVAAAALVALGLAAVGLAGLIAGSVAERRRELSIRTALGASPVATVASAALPGLAVAGTGLAVGLGLAALLAPGLSALIYGVGLADPLTYLGVSGVLLGVAAVASLVPALRVLRFDPATALRAG